LTWGCESRSREISDSFEESVRDPAMVAPSWTTRMISSSLSRFDIVEE